MTCKRCIFYVGGTGYCLKLGRYVKDPLNPPCQVQIASSKKVSKSVTQVVGNVPTLPSPTSSVSSNTRKVIPPHTYPMDTSQVSSSSVGYTYSQSGNVPNYDIERPGALSTQAIMTIEEFRDYITPTGIPRLDEILGGGFLRGKTYLVAGETGCGKTIFSIQFLLYGALIGEPGVYIAIDEPTDQLVKGLRKFGWDVSSLVKAGKLLFLDMRTHFSKIYLKDERKKIEPRFIIDSILQAAKKIRAKRLVIDPIAPLIYGGSADDVLYAREFLREMVFAIERVGTLTTIMTSEIPTGSNQLSRFGVEEFLASGIIVLGLTEIRGNIERIMYIRKARWAPVKPSKYIFDIVPGTGVVIRAPLSEYYKSL